MKKRFAELLYKEPKFEAKVFEQFQIDIWYLNTKRIRFICLLSAVLTFIFTAALDLYYYFAGQWPNPSDLLSLVSVHILIIVILLVFYALFRSVCVKSARHVPLQKKLSIVFVMVIMLSTLMVTVVHFRTTGSSMTFTFVACFIMVAFYWNIRQVSLIYIASIVLYAIFLISSTVPTLVVALLLNFILFITLFFVLSRSLYQTKVHEFQMMIRLQDNTENLKDRNFELDQFVYKATHDIRAPLTSILGLINVIKMEKERSEVDKYVLLLEDRALKLDTFIKSMLDFSRSAKLNLIISEVDVEGIISQCIEELQFHKNFSRISVKKKINLKAPLYSDVFRLTIILKNLISNSVKYLDPAKKENIIEIAVLNGQNDNIIIRVKDNGIGIKKNYLENLFKMFYKAHEHSEGAGLGLYIVKQTVKKLSGKISVESEVGEGSEFRIILPNSKEYRGKPSRNTLHDNK